MSSVGIGDAYVRGSAGGSTWTVGTGTVEMTCECRGGLLKLVSFKNKLTNPAREYVSKGSAVALFSLPGDGWFLALEYLAEWKLSMDYEPSGAAVLSADIRQEHITPDKDGHITIRVTAVGPNDAILQGVEIE